MTIYDIVKRNNYLVIYIVDKFINRYKEQYLFEIFFDPIFDQNLKMIILKLFIAISILIFAVDDVDLNI
jgi:hypothetical protein